MTASPTQSKSARSGVRLLQLLIIITALAPVLYRSADATLVPEDVRFLSGILWILCWLPAFIYLARSPERRPPIPFLAIIGAAHGMYYALQLAVGVDNANRVQTISLAALDPREDYQTPIQLALAGWIALLVGYAMAKQFLPARPVSLGGGISNHVLRVWGIRLMFGGIAADFLRQALPVPVVLRGALNFAAMLAQLGLALLILLDVRGRLKRRHRLAILAGFSAILLLAIGTGSIASGVFATLVALIALWIGGQRVRAWWIIAALAGAAVFVSLRGVAMDYRRIAWFTDEQLPVGQRSQVILGILADRVDRDGAAGAVMHGWDVVATRSANLDLFADVVRRTPSEVPYWNGETYLSLVGIAVPRVFWPNKPVKELGQSFGHRYRYLGGADVSTSINLPYFVEFYCNFGSLGVLLGMLLVGVIYVALEQRINVPGQNSTVSIGALVLLVPLVNIESDFSLIFGGLLLNGAALWLLLRYIANSAGALQPSARHRAGLASVEGIRR